MDEHAGCGTFSPICSKNGLKLLQGMGMGTNIGNLGCSCLVAALCQLARLEASMDSLENMGIPWGWARAPSLQM